MEVCEGIKDHLVRDPAIRSDTRWEYTYTSVCLARRALDRRDRPDRAHCPAAAETPFTRRAQAITWKVWKIVVLRSAFAEALVPVTTDGGRGC